MENEKQTKTDISRITKGLNYIVEKAEETEKKVEQARTIIKKKLFLETFAKSGGVVTVCCDKIGLSREQYYEWKKSDLDFAKELENVNNKKNEIAEDLLWAMITIKKDAPSIRYYLDRRHPLYKPKNETEVIAGDRTLEDIIDEDEAKLNLKPKKDIKQIENDGKNNKDKQISDREVVEDKDKAGNESAVCSKPGAVVLLGEEDKTKPNTESETKGA